MAEKEYFIDDRVIIPEKIKRMTKEERKAEIKKLEAEAIAAKKAILEQRNNTIVS